MWLGVRVGCIAAGVVQAGGAGAGVDGVCGSGGQTLRGCVGRGGRVRCVVGKQQSVSAIRMEGVVRGMGKRRVAAAYSRTLP